MASGSWVPDRYGGLRRLVWGTRVEDEVAEEMEAHLAMRMEEYMSAGMRSDQARDEALRRFGDRTTYERQTQEIERAMLREKRRSDFLDAVGRELRAAVRGLVRSRSFALIAGVTLALGIGATTAIFTVLDAVVLRALPYANAERLVWLESPVPGLGEGARFGLSQAQFFHFADQAKSFEALGAYASVNVNLVEPSGVERIRLASITAGLLDVLGARAVAGRLIQPHDDTPDGTPVVLLSHELWQNRYGGDPAIVGRMIRINTRSMEVIGVAQPGLGLPDQPVDAWMALGLDPAAPPINEHYLNAIGRLRPGVTVEATQAELQRLTSNFPALFPQAYPESFMRESGFWTRVMPLRDHVIGEIDRVLWILLGSVSLVLLIACANVANLFLVRAEARRQEHAVRVALGAERAHLAWHYVTEALVLSLASAVAALLIAFGAIKLLIATAPAGLPRLAEIGLSGRSVAFALGLAVVAGIVFGLFPVVRAVAANLVLREAGRGQTASRRRLAIRSSMVVGQVGLALVLVAAAGLMLRSYLELRAVQPGFNAQNVLVFRVALPFTGYEDHSQSSRYFQQLIARIEALPGVERAGSGSDLPLAGFGGCSIVVLADRPLAEGLEAPCVKVPAISPGYFDVLRIPVRGRQVDWQESENGARSVVVSRTFAERYWPGEDPIGKAVYAGSERGDPFRVVGVAEDVLAEGVDRPASDAVYFPTTRGEGMRLWGPYRFPSVIVRTRTSDPLALTGAVRAAARAVDPNVPIFDLATMQDIVNRSPSVARASFTLLLLALAGSLALVLSAVGLYGVISYVVAQRRSEIGIRMALGAKESQVGALVVRQALRLALLGVVIGLAVAVVATQALRSVLFGVSPGDPLTLAAVAAVLVSIAVLASYAPARRAARIDPVEALRAQ